MGLLLLLLLFLSVREQANSYPWCLWARDMATGEQVQAPPPRGHDPSASVAPCPHVRLRLPASARAQNVLSIASLSTVLV